MIMNLVFLTVATAVATVFASPTINLSKVPILPKHLAPLQLKWPLHLGSNNLTDQSFDISEFSWTSCSSSPQPTVKINSLNIGISNSFTVPGTFPVTASATITAPIVAPIRMEIHAWKKEFFGWVELPCQIEQHNICNIPNACALIPPPPCPAWMVKNNLPCQCPIGDGTYATNRAYITVPEIPIDIPSFLDDGHYKIQISGYDQNDNQLACVQVLAKVNAYNIMR